MVGTWVCRHSGPAGGSRATSLLLAGVMLWSTSSLAQEATYVGQVRIFAADYCPVGYLPMNGQQLQIADYEHLFTLIETTFGGDGETTFALPTAAPIRTANGEPLIQCISLGGLHPQ